MFTTYRSEFIKTNGIIALIVGTVGNALWTSDLHCHSKAEGHFNSCWMHVARSVTFTGSGTSTLATASLPTFVLTVVMIIAVALS